MWNIIFIIDDEISAIFCLFSYWKRPLTTIQWERTSSMGVMSFVWYLNFSGGFVGTQISEKAKKKSNIKNSNFEFN